MSPIDRRTAVATLASAVCGLGGCLGEDGDSDTERTAGGPSATTEPATATPTTTTRVLAERDPRDLLPEAGEGWQFVDTDQYAWTTLGATDGVRGIYRSPDDVAYHAVVMTMSEEYPAPQEARTLYCQAGWPVAVAYESVAFAAGSGTPQRTHTPEKPPTMDRTAVPGTDDRAHALLARSPALSSEIVDANRVTDDDC